MHSAFNQRIGNKERTTGNVAEYMKNRRHLIQKNDGTRDFTWKTINFESQAPPFPESQETVIKLTHPDHDITQFSDSFITVKVKPTLKLYGIKNINDPNRLLKLACVWKSSNQSMRESQIYNRNRSVGYLQKEMIREGFAYSTIKDDSEKKRKRFTHSPYENVSNYSQSICGIYIDVADFADGKAHEVEFEINIPIEDILALQAFDDFPNFACGDVELHTYFSHRGLVWCMIDPTKIKDYKEVLEGEIVDLDMTRQNFHAMFKHGFTQIDNEAEIIDSFDIRNEEINDVVINYASATSGSCVLQCVAMSIEMGKSNICGYKITDASKHEIMDDFQIPMFIPSQYLTQHSFPVAASSKGIHTSLNIPLTNVTNITVVFPKHDNDITVFENPVYDNLQLTVNNRNVPDESVSTNDARFFQYQLIAADLTGGLQCTQEFEDSYVMTRNDIKGDRYKNTLRDASSFMWLNQLERNGAGYTFDGYDSKGQNVSVQIKGQPIYTGANDTYYNVNRDGSIHPPAPEIWLCRDCYFKVSTAGIEFVDDTPPDSQA